MGADEVQGADKVQQEAKAEALDSRIVKFIAKHHVLTLSTAIDGVSYCSNIFYAYDAQSGMFVFASSEGTRHVSEMQANSTVSASVVVESKVVGILQGLQICGQARHEFCDTISEPMRSRMRSAYLKRFPYAAVAELSLWYLEPTFLKFTDNKLGFGKKLIWQK